MFEIIGQRVAWVLVGPLDKLPELYARGRWRFALTRGLVYAALMLIGLTIVDLVSDGPVWHSVETPMHRFLKISSYFVAQFIAGTALSLLVWRFVRRLAELQMQQRELASQRARE